MIEELKHGVWRIEVVLPDTPLKSVNAYFIRGTERNLLIDLGFNHPKSKACIQEAMSSLDFSMENTDIFLTHLHADHSGMTASLACSDTRIIASHHTAKFMKWLIDGFECDLAKYLEQTGLEAAGLSPADRGSLPEANWRSEVISDVEVIADGDFIEVGDLKLKCVETNGHCVGHICLYDASKKLLFSGDHILGDITPNNTLNQLPWDAKSDYLGNYLKNLDKIKALDVEYALPGHRQIILNCHERIEELKAHHQLRLNAIIDVIKNKKMSAAQVAQGIPWNIRIKSWSEFPVAQKFFSTGEVLSHLNHLVFLGIAQKELVDGIVVYTVV